MLEFHKSLNSQGGEVIGDIVALVEFVLNRGEKSKETQKEFFFNFVEPAYAQFKLIHGDYLKSFQKYRELIQNSNEPLNLEHKVIAEIRQDHINTRNNVQEALNLASVIDSHFQGDYFNIQIQKNKKGQSEPEFAFANTILDYILLGTTSDYDLLDKEKMYYGNVPRRKAATTLTEIFSGEEDEKTKAKKSIEKLNNVLEELQIQYDGVSKKYLQLKLHFLN